MKTFIKNKMMEIVNLQLSDLKTIASNRKIIENQVKVLGRSIKKHNILRLPVVVETSVYSGSKELYILDGQHLVKVLINEGIKSTPCFLVKENNRSKIVDLMATLNNTSKRWKAIDYINHYAANGNPDYQQLLDDINLYKFTPTICGLVTGSRGLIKKGTFRYYRPDSQKLYKYLNDIRYIIPDCSNYFLNAFITFYRELDKYNHSKLVKLLKRELHNGQKFEFSTAGAYLFLTRLYYEN